MKRDRRREKKGAWRRVRVCPCGAVYAEPDLRDLWITHRLEEPPVHLWPPCAACGAEPAEYAARVARPVRAPRFLGFGDRLVGWELRGERADGKDAGFVRAVLVGSEREAAAAREMLS